MVQFSNILLAIDKVHTVLQRALDCRPGLGGLTQMSSGDICFSVRFNQSINTCGSLISHTNNASLSDLSEVMIWILKSSHGIE